MHTHRTLLFRFCLPQMYVCKYILHTEILPDNCELQTTSVHMYVCTYMHTFVFVIMYRLNYSPVMLVNGKIESLELQRSCRRFSIMQWQTVITSVLIHVFLGPSNTSTMSNTNKEKPTPILLDNHEQARVEFARINPKSGKQLSALGMTKN